MKNFRLYGTTIVLAVALTGCTATKNVSKGIAEKSISGSGTIALSKVGLDVTTQTPEIFNLMVVGDYNSHTGEGEQFRAEYSEDVSIFNSNAKSKNYKMIFFSNDKKRVDSFIDKATESVSEISTEKDSAPKE